MKPTITAIALLLLAGCGSGEPANRPPLESVVGTVTVANPCNDLGGFSDVASAQIRVNDINTGQLLELIEPAAADDIGQRCRVYFATETVPDVGLVELEMGRRGTRIVDTADAYETTVDGVDVVMLFELTLGID